MASPGCSLSQISSYTSLATPHTRPHVCIQIGSILYENVSSCGKCTMTFLLSHEWILFKSMSHYDISIIFAKSSTAVQRRCAQCEYLKQNKTYEFNYHKLQLFIRVCYKENPNRLTMHVVCGRNRLKFIWYTRGMSQSNNNKNYISLYWKTQNKQECTSLCKTFFAPKKFFFFLFIFAIAIVCETSVNIFSFRYH